MYTDITKNVVITTGSTDSTAPIQTVTITCIALPDELIFVDCGVFPKIASQFRSDMEKRFQRNTSHLLLTHTHWDHIFAMEAFEDVTVVTSKVGIQYLKRNLKGAFSKEKREKMAERRFSDDR
jgi:glyoxylase-like metal-dependent hydrolase (beta-lactamase superfamily II)